MNRMTLTSLIVLSLLTLPSCTRGVMEPQSLHLDVPTMNGIGWTGGGGRTEAIVPPTSEVGTTSSGIGVFGGGGRSDSTSTQNSAAGIGVFGGGG